MDSPAAPTRKIKRPPPLTNDLLEQIFLRLRSPADLARVSVACASFHQIVTERSFRRRFRALRRPAFLGFVNSHGFHPAEPPYPSASLASDLASAADFTYSFVPLPDGGPRWLPRDVRDGRVLLECSIHGEGKDISTNLAVCDPLFRRYVRLPRIPEGLTTLQQDGLMEFASLLAPIGEDEDETSFKVIGMAQYESKVLVFVFSSTAGEWCVAASPTWSDLDMVPPPFHACLSYFDYVHGSFYLAASWMNKLLVLDVCRMELSATDIPTDCANQRKRRGLPRVVKVGEGAFGLCTLVGYAMPAPQPPQKVYYTTWQNNGESSQQCQLERVITLAGRYAFNPAGSTEGLLFIEGLPMNGLQDNWDLYYFSLDINTSELKKVCRTRLYFGEVTRVHPYFGFPPSLSKPSL